MIGREPNAAGRAPVIALALIAICSVVGEACGATMASTTIPPPPRSHVTRRGARLVYVPAPDPALVLVIDAGQRDAGDSPGAAREAARAAAREAGPSASADVLPDGTVVTIPCEGMVDASCAERLARALGARRSASSSRTGDASVASPTPSDADTAGPVAAADGARLAGSLALATAAGVNLPVGPSDAPSGAAVEGFLASHYGPSRALVLVLAPAADSTAFDVVEAAIEDAPDATAPRATRQTHSPRRAAAVEGVVAAVGAAMRWADPEGGATAASRLAHELARDSATAWSITSMSLRESGTWVVAAADSSRDPERDAWTVAHALMRVHAELALGTPHLPRTFADEVALMAADFVTRGPIEGDRRSESPSARSPGDAREKGGDASTLTLTFVVDDASEDAIAEAETRLTSIAEGATRPIELRGALDDARASLVATNGARLDVLRVETPGRVATAWLASPGTDAETDGDEGMTAVVATALARACGSGEFGSSGAFGSLGVRVTPVVTPDVFGVTVEAPAFLITEVVALLSRCMSTSALEDDAVERAELAVLAAAERAYETEAGWLRAAVTHLPSNAVDLAPTPVAEARSLDAAKLRDHLERSLVGARTALTFVGEVDPRRVADVALRRLARLEAGTTGPDSGTATSDDGAVVSFPAPTASAAAVVTWAASHQLAPPDAERVARAFAAAVARELGLEPGVEVRVAHGSAGAQRAYVFLAVRLRDDVVDHLPALVGAAATRAARDARENARVASLELTAADWAVAVGRARLGGATTRAWDSLVRALATGTPRFAVGKRELPPGDAANDASTNGN